MKRRLQKLAFAVAVPTVLLLAVEGAASLWRAGRQATAATDRMAGNPYSVFDPELGWRHRPGESAPHLFGPDRSFTTNSLGLRAPGEYAREPAAGRYRIMFLGDSFTLGHGAGDGETFPARVEARCPEIESLNLGVGGYGLDQSLLWYRQVARELDHRLVVFAVIRDDFFRIAGGYYMGQPKPHLALRHDRLEPDNLPLAPPARPGGLPWLRQLARHSALVELLRGLAARARPGMTPDFDPRDDSWEPVARAIFKALAEETRARGQRLVVAFLPDLHHLQDEGADAFTDWLGEAMAAGHVAWLDLTPAFRTVFSPDQRWRYFLNDGHYTRAGYDLVARTLLDELPRLVEGFPDCPPAPPPPGR